MRISIFCGALLFFCAPALAQYSGGYYGGNYSIERWDEDYSYLKNPANRRDLFDPIKYIPINADRDWYLSFGGQLRWRMDYFNNSEFGAGLQDEDGFQLFRILAHMDAHFGQNFRVFLQMDSGLSYGRAGGPRLGDVDVIDLQQGFFDLRFPFDPFNSLTMRAGRQELIYGAQRLVSPNDWANVRRTFDGLKVSFSTVNDTVDAFVVRPVLIAPYMLNSENAHSTFAGVYNVTAFPDQFPHADAKLDTYLFLLDNSKSPTTHVAVDSDTFTLGIRPHARPTPWDFDLEADWQFGHLGSHSINAWSIAAEAGYTLTNVMFTPRAAIGFDIASGSPDPWGRFNQLFPPTYLYLGHLYLFGRENIIDLHPELDFNLPYDLTLSIAQHFFWRQNLADAAYNLQGGVVRAADGSRAPYTGSEFDIALYWQIQQHISAYTGYAHFFPGPFIVQTGPHSGEDFFYISMTFTF